MELDESSKQQIAEEEAYRNKLRAEEEYRAQLNHPANNKKWYKSSTLIVLLLIFFFPLGFFLMWKYAIWGKPIKWIITAVVVLLLIIGTTSRSESTTQSSVSPSPTFDVSKPTTETNASPSGTLVMTKPTTHIPYEVKEISTAHGVLDFIIIDPKYVTSDSLIGLGKDLHADYTNNSLMRISIYDDIKAVQIRDKVVFDDNVSKADTDYYDAHYIAQYNKNDNTKYNQFIIYHDASTGGNKTINY